MNKAEVRAATTTSDPKPKHASETIVDRAAPSLVAHMLHLQRTVGNQAVLRMMAEGRLMRTPEDAAATPAAPTAAEQVALADQIRQLYPQGISVALSIPNAVGSREEAMDLPRASLSGYAWQSAWSGLDTDEPAISASIQSFWTQYRESRPDIFGEINAEAEAATETATRTSEDAAIAAAVEANRVATATERTTITSSRERDASRTRRRRELDALRATTRTARSARQREARTLTSMRTALRTLPAQFPIATARQQRLIRSALFEHMTNPVKDYLWENHHEPLARIEFQNNAEFQSQAQAFAQSHQSLALVGGQLRIGQHMTYHTPNEIPQQVNAVHTAVRQLLRDHPGQAEAGAGDDEAIARVKSMALFAHGGRGWMGGHHEAASADFRTRDVPAMINAMSSVLASDIRLALFACSTGSGSTARGASDAERTGEGSLADTFAEQLARDHAESTVMGHTTAAHTVRNANIRAFSGTGDEGGRNIQVARPSGTPLLNDELINSEQERTGINAAVTQQIESLQAQRRRQRRPEMTEAEITAKRTELLTPMERLLRQAMIDCYATEVAFFDGLRDAHSAADLRPEFIALWTSLVPPDGAVARAIKTGRYRENWSSLRPPG